MKTEEGKGIIFSVGDKIPTSNTRKPSYIKVMAVEDGYVMFRRAGCIPGVMSLKEFGVFVDNNCITKTKSQ